MGEKLVIGPINRGLRTDREPFNIDNDSFPTLINAYQWRGRIKRKRGTSLLGRLRKYLGTTNGSGNLTVNPINPHAIATGVSWFIIGTDVFVDGGGASPVTLTTNSSGSAILDRTTGVLTIAGSQANTAVFYLPGLPVLGLEDLILNVNQFPGTLAFDTTYAYNIQTSYPYGIYDVSYYKNPPVDATNLPGYVQKGTVTSTWWNSQDYQQTWTVNYQGALWTTNGVTQPFSTTNIGMQYKAITTVDNITTGPPAFADLTITGHGLVVGDFVFINEVITTTGINFQTGYVTAVVNANKVTVEFPFATIANNGTGGIAQYLTNRSDTTKDCLRWYDGDPTNGSATAPVVNGNKGWVNFAPPLSQGTYSIADLPPAQYYLVGARMILPFKDRLLFVGPVVQTSSAGSQVYLRDTVIYSQNGTPYYTASYTNTPSAAVDTPASATNVFHPILTPNFNSSTYQTATPSAYFEDQTGFGGFISAGVDMAITTAYPNEDVIIMGMERMQTRFVYTGNDVVPFNFFIINSELGSGSTYSGIVMDKGVISKGSRGYIQTSQVESSRIDLDIPDQVFEVNLANNGTERVTAQRDYINEWIYITYPSNQVSYKFPNQTLQYNYRDDSWAIFDESYTTYGLFRRQSGFTWATIGLTYSTWAKWNDPWSAGSSTLYQPEVIAGNQQGFVIFRDDGTNEDTSLTIQAISGSTITSPNHTLSVDDYIMISGCLGTIGNQINGRIYQVATATSTTFTTDPSLPSGTYLGSGLITRMYVPYIQTRQFPVSWSMARKTRIGPQQYLLSTTNKAQITLLIFLSQNNESPYNDSFIIPNVNSTNDALIYSTVLYTCPESTNLGLTPANTNLQMPTAPQQQQIWHRINTSLLGDTIQLGFTLSDTQMTALDLTGISVSITGASKASSCVLIANNAQPNGSVLISAGQLVQITGVQGMTELNGVVGKPNIYYVTTSNTTTITIAVDSTNFSTYTSGGTAAVVAPNNQFAEIEIHGMVLDVSPSQLLA